MKQQYHSRKVATFIIIHLNLVNQSQLIICIHHDSSWFIMIHHDSLSFIIIHYHSLSFIIIHYHSSFIMTTVWFLKDLTQHTSQAAVLNPQVCQDTQTKPVRSPTIPKLTWMSSETSDETSARTTMTTTTSNKKQAQERQQQQATSTRAARTTTTTTTTTTTQLNDNTHAHKQQRN